MFFPPSLRPQFSLPGPFRQIALLFNAMAIAILLAGMTASAQAEEIKTAQVVVTGEGEVSLAPDMAIASLGVTTEAETARNALSANNEAMADVIESMKNAGVEAKDLQTSGFSIQPRYNHHVPRKSEELKPPSIVGYTVSNNLTVRIRDLSSLGEIMDKSVTLGVNTGGSIQFVNDKTDDAIRKARIAAMKDARNKALTLTKAAGVELGRLVEISENSHRPGPIAMARGRMMAEAAMASPVPVEGGENTYRVSVSAIWEINQ